MSTVPPRIAVVGAAGFLGSALVRAARGGGLRVATFTRRVPFLTDASLAAPGVGAARTVFWLATSINPAIAEADPGAVAADRNAFTALLHALERLPRPPRVVLLSSGGTVYDPDSDPPYREDAPVRPVGAYGRAKLELESLLHQADLPPHGATVVRVANAYGPGQPAASGQGVIAHWLQAARRGEPVTVFGDGSTTRDYVYVDDIASALVAIDGHTGTLPATVNVGSGVPTTLRTLAELVRDVTGDARRVRYEEARRFDLTRTWLDIGLAREALGWQPTVDLRAGVTEVWRTVAGPRTRLVGADAAAAAGTAADG